MEKTEGEIYREGILKGFLEIEFVDSNGFSKVRETLTRIGLSNKERKKLYQSCHVFHKRGKYYIVHFKELYLLDGKKAEMSNEDISRRNMIATILEDWELIKIVDHNKITESTPSDLKVPLHILSVKDKETWTLIPQYTIGKVSLRKTL